MSFVSAADIVKLGKVAWQLWDMGFSKAKNAAIQYAEFGADIQDFATNLTKLGEVIGDVTKQVPASLSHEGRSRDLKSLLQICGDFRKTLNECQRLLNDSSKFEKGRGNFIYNVRWNLSMEPQVSRLRDRVAFHNIKIATILKPLELKLLLDLKKDIYDVHGDLASRITEIHEILRRIDNYGIRIANGNSEDIFDAPPVSPKVPDYLEIKFEAAIKAVNPELTDRARFPLAQGINAFHHHFEQSTSKFHPENTSLEVDFFAGRTPEPAQYLNLMKSIWIVQMVKLSDEYAKSMSDKLWECYVRELDEKCQREFSRFTRNEPPTKRLKEPDRRYLDLLREEEFSIWLEDEEDDFDDKPDLDYLSEIYLEDEEGDFDDQPGPDYLNGILHILLASPGRNITEELVLLPRGDTKLEMQRVSGRAKGSANRKTFITDVNLEGALFVPLYATPKSTPDALNIVFKGDKSHENAISLSFLKLQDLLDFQQAVSGYKVVYDKKDIKTLTYTFTGLWRGKQKSEHGKVQIWTRRLLKDSQLKVQTVEPPKYCESVARGSKAPSMVPSLTWSSTTYQSSSIGTEDTTAISLELPDPPLLVLYLSPNNEGNDEMSFLRIEMDRKTSTKDKGCICGRDRSNCIHSTIERSGDLIAQRVEADSDNEVLNLASLGAFQKPKHPVSVKKMKYIQIEFRTHDERIKFETRFRESQQIYQFKLSLYWAEMRKEERNRSLLRTDLDFREHGLKIPHDAAQAGSKKPILPSLSPIPLRFEYSGNLIWNGLETYKKCEGVMDDVLTIARSNNSQDCYVARPVSEFLSECYPAFGLHLLSWITRVCENCQKLESNTTSKDFVSMRNRISQTKPNEVTQGLAESETANRQISTEREDFDPQKEVIGKLVTGATNTIIKGYLEAGQLRWVLSTPSKVHASEIKSTLSWTLSALRCQSQDAQGLYFCTPVSLDTGLPEITRFELISIESYCWTNLFSYACITDLPSLRSEKKGLEIDFSLLLQLAAVDQEVETENGPIFFGFDTALIPLDPPESKRWHFLATEGRQITPARVKREFGKRKKEKMEGSNVWFQGNLEQDYRKGNVYVGWCTAPLVEIRSDTTSVDDICKASGLPLVQDLEEPTERSSGNDVSFFSRIGFFGFSIGASGGKKRERKFKQVSLVAKYTQEGNFEGVLTSARATPCILWDQSAERAWLVSAVSALLLASTRYVKWKKYSFKSMQIDGQFSGQFRFDHAPKFTNTTRGPEAALRRNQMLLVDEADGVTVNDEVLFQDIVKRMWSEMSIGEDLCCSSATGKKHEEKECILGYDLNEVVCGKKKYLRSLRVSPCIKNWQPLAHANEAQVIFCKDIGTVIRCNPPTEPRDCCTRNCPKGALSCLIQDLRIFYGGCWDNPLNLPAPPPNAGALSIGHDYEWIPRGCMPGSRKEVELCSRSLLSIATREPQSRKLRKKKLQTTEVQKKNVELLPWTFPVLVTFGSVVIATN